mmetsp:Transcript_22529/g.26553  ORF Transcript_22529/g.26553 Transcript_22529/m.26553 type:complete len:390 (+) Transcript_22529:81-1250(+)
MGAGASIQPKVDEATVRKFAGDFFDQAKFDEMKDAEGFVLVEQLLGAAAASVERMDEQTVRLLVGDQFDEAFYNANKELDGTIATGHLFLALGMKPPTVSDDELKKKCYEDGSYLQFATPEQQDNITVAITAVCNRGSALKFCSDRLRDDVRLVKLALKFDGTNIGFASPRLQQDPELIALALELLPSYSMKWEAVQLAAKLYSKDFDALHQAKIALRGDADVIRVVVAENGLGLKYAMPYVRHERSVVKLAIEQNSQAVFYASAVAMVLPDDKEATGPIDPEVLGWIEERHAKEDRNDPKTGWCPDPAAVEKTVARFPELAKFSPPTEWLSTCADRVAKEEAERDARRKAKREKREAEEKDAAWKAGMAAAQIDQNAFSETKESEAKE